jgi:hypothetical protein
MIGLIAICVVKNCKEQERLGKLRTGITLVFEGLRVPGRYCVWDVLGKNITID